MELFGVRSNILRFQKTPAAAVALGVAVGDALGQPAWVQGQTGAQHAQASSVRCAQALVKRALTQLPSLA